VKTSYILSGLAGATLGLAALSAPAAASTTITGEVSNIDARASDPGLVVQANPVAFPSFTLNNVGDYADFTVLTIGTREGSVEFDDLFSYPITATFTFSSPAGATGPAVTGSTSGFIQLFTSCGIINGGCGRVEWNAPSVFNFGTGGQFSVELFDTTFGTPGTANVTGRFTLLAPGVPEPSTWALLILGFGAVGFMMRSSRRRQNVTVSYA